jgi:PAS domain S-box-containing protein
VFSPEKGKLALVLRDTTERKETEIKLKETMDNLENLVEERTAELEKAYNLLKESEEGLAEAQKMAHIGNWDWDLVTGKVHWSDEMYRIYGRNPQESGASLDELLNYVHPDDRDYVDKAIKKGLNCEPTGIDYRIILSNGEERIVHAQAKVIFDEKNIPIRVKGITQEITERKKAEEKIEILANAVESSSDAIVTRSLEDIIISWNKGAEQLFGYSAEEILGKHISILEPDTLKGEMKRFSEKIKQGKRVQHYETSRIRKNGTTINVSVTLSPVFDASGELVAISAIARDITERIKTEEALAKTEDARKKEIHHRIKNNLQVISSLLDLQAEKFIHKKIAPTPEVLEAFKESQNRVISMSLIHEELYKGDGNDTLDFSEYLRKLTENLFRTYSLYSKNIRMCMNLEENAFFNMDTAVPLGIIVNELVSNSLKHAFPNRYGGEIRIRLFREEENSQMHESLFSLTISDNGKGIPEKTELESVESLGLQLVSILVDQLDGKIEIKRAQGTEFRITFNVEENHKSGQKVKYSQYSNIQKSFTDI